ncbi:hypothetical protein E4L96_12450 [Massilia arenosa]|uniref:CopL family metal-binding regulatory protein n=1 Tax=Zemynaea arenosa TaxID=2561931 RepID=A0A4Y9SAP0_9BURK|nr:hypothetical protein [Massilia arenosa]TFW19072.1 hypothetical protein E4L96_12450 [Massilia arenosa]
MKTVIRTLFVWLLLCAIPFQGYAMARMACGAMAGQQAPAALDAVPTASQQPHQHQLRMQHHAAADSTHAAHPALSCSAQDCSADHGNSPQHGKCGTVGGCCIAFALVPSAPPVLASSNAVTSAVPFLDRFVPDTVLSTLERPPRSALS